MSGARIALLACLPLLVGCRVMQPAPSLTLLSANPTHAVYEPVAAFSERRDCTQTWLVLFGGGTPPVHEATIRRLLDDTQADVLLNAQVLTEELGLIVYQRSCAIVRGQPARLVRKDDQ